MTHWPKMCRVHASALSADVIEFLVQGNGADKQLIDVTVGEVQFSLTVPLAHELPIALVLTAGLPDPAALRQHRFP
jgi:hypothetical protein